MTRLVPLALLVAAASVSAQEADTLTAADGWRSSLVASVAGNQASFSNWQEGGIDALAVTASAEGAFDRVVGRFLTTQRARLAIGVLRQDTLDVRKALDVARYAVSAELATDDPFRPTASFSARSQFAPGFDFAPTEADYPTLTIVPGEPLKVSDAFSPLILSQSAGLAYRPGTGFVARTGLALKETVVSIERLRPVFGNALDQPVRVEAGVDAELALEREVMNNVLLRSQLSAFQAFGQIGNEAPDILFENTLVLKVNDLLNVTLDGAALFDADISTDLQLRQSLAVGVAVALL
ncbi:MAG: DUF3078 domain-containing protein [Bacteroidota bacterium]